MTEDGKTEVHRLRHSRFRKVFRGDVVTRQALGWVGAQIAILSMLDPSLSKAAPWHVAIISSRHSPPLQDDEVRFIHYLELRLLAAAEGALRQGDELEHVGLYNKINFYHELPVRRC